MIKKILNLFKYKKKKLRKKNMDENKKNNAEIINFVNKSKNKTESKLKKWKLKKWIT